MRRWAIPVALTCVAMLAIASLTATRTTGAAVSNAEGPVAEPTEGSEQRARAEAAEELQEQAEATEGRLEALAAALADGSAGRTGPLRRTPAPGWVGEFPLDPQSDDWEPAIAADPRAPWVYVLATRYGEPKPCQGNCPSPMIVMKISPDGGKTWQPTVPLCTCRGANAQYDPIIEVVPDTGAVYAAWLNGGFNTVFAKSTDHGRTWTEPVETFGKISWTDKPVLATSDDGRDVYVSWNGPTGGDLYVAQSHDAGRTWTQTKLADSKRYYFAYDADVLADGGVVITQGSITYTAPGGGAEGVVKQHVIVSPDRGQTWRNIVVDTVKLGPPCVAEGCSSDFYLGHSAISADARGRLIFLYDGATTTGGPQQIWARRSADGGRTWSAHTSISSASENATSPAVESRGDGDVRAYYFQTRDGSDDAWNIWYRRSLDGGRTWSAPVKISDAAGGTAYKTPEGFLEVYGDYGEIAITSQGDTIAAWGEGASWLGPGGVWINRQR